MRNLLFILLLLPSLLFAQAQDYKIMGNIRQKNATGDSAMYKVYDNNGLSINGDTTKNAFSASIGTSNTDINGTGAYNGIYGTKTGTITGGDHVFLVGCNNTHLTGGDNVVCLGLKDITFPSVANFTTYTHNLYADTNIYLGNTLKLITDSSSQIGNGTNGLMDLYLRGSILNQTAVLMNFSDTNGVRIPGVKRLHFGINNNYIYETGSNEFSFACNSSDIFRINNSGTTNYYTTYTSAVEPRTNSAFNLGSSSYNYNNIFSTGSIYNGSKQLIDLSDDGVIDIIDFKTNIRADSNIYAYGDRRYYKDFVNITANDTINGHIYNITPTSEYTTSNIALWLDNKDIVINEGTSPIGRVGIYDENTIKNYNDSVATSVYSDKNDVINYKGYMANNYGYASLNQVVTGTDIDNQRAKTKDLYGFKSQNTVRAANRTGNQAYNEKMINAHMQNIVGNYYTSTSDSVVNIASDNILNAQAGATTTVGGLVMYDGRLRSNVSTGTLNIENVYGLKIVDEYGFNPTGVSYGIYEDLGRVNYFGADTNTFDGDIIHYGDYERYDTITNPIPYKAFDSVHIVLEPTVSSTGSAMYDRFTTLDILEGSAPLEKWGFYGDNLVVNNYNDSSTYVQPARRVQWRNHKGYTGQIIGNNTLVSAQSTGTDRAKSKKITAAQFKGLVSANDATSSAYCEEMKALDLLSFCGDDGVSIMEGPMYGIYVQNTTTAKTGATTTVPTNYGIYVYQNNTSTGGTFNETDRYGLYLNDVSTSTPTKDHYGIYQTGAPANYFSADSNKFDGSIFKGTTELIDLESDSVDFKVKTNSKYFIAQNYAIGDSTQSITNADQYYTITEWNNEESENITATDSTLTISAGGAGWYNIDCHLSFTHSANNTVVHFSLFVNDVEVNQGGEAQRKIGTGGDVGNASWKTRKYLQGYDVLKVKIKASNAGGTMTYNHGGFGCERIN